MKTRGGAKCTAEAAMSQSRWDDPVSRELGLHPSTLASQENTPAPMYGTVPLRTVADILNQEEEPGLHLLPCTGLLQAEQAEADAGRLLEIMQSLLAVLQGATSNANAQSMQPEVRHGISSCVQTMDWGLRTFSSGLDNMRLLMEKDITLQAKRQMIVMHHLISRLHHLRCCMDDMVLTKQAQTRLDVTEYHLQTAYNSLQVADARMYKRAGSMQQMPLQSAHAMFAAEGLLMYASSKDGLHAGRSAATSSSPSKKRKNYHVVENQR
tara:strand:+ start:1091 stop:1891 length:801 start_codon:yes stop_codon:yes gene_type:complete